MAKEQFFHAESHALFKRLEQLSHHSGVSRGQAFEDWLTAMVCALASETMEEPYLAMVERHKAGTQGHRGIDLMASMMAELVNAMEQTDDDILGDIFQGCISYGENGLYLTPDALTHVMAQLTVDPDARSEDGQPLYINDPCCGTGRMLLHASTMNPDAELVGRDIDARCARIAAVNLGLRHKYGWVICGDTISGKTQFAYRIAPFFHEGPHGLRRGVIREVPVEVTPLAALAQTTSRAAADLFEQQDSEQTALPEAIDTGLPAIIEIPPWVARLEARVTARDRSDTEGDAPDGLLLQSQHTDETGTHVTEYVSPDGEHGRTVIEMPDGPRQSNPDDDDDPLVQRELFD